MPGVVTYEDVYLIFPMLEGRCRGKKQAKFGLKYVYGPCAHFAWEIGPDGVGLGGCKIHEDKPRMCSGYPYYGRVAEMTMGAMPPANPGVLKGCGYNADPNAGNDRSVYAADKLMPLDENER